MLVRPFKDVLLKEIVLYNRFARLQSFALPLVSSMVPARSSINQISESELLICTRLFNIAHSICLLRAAARLYCMFPLEVQSIKSLRLSGVYTDSKTNKIFSLHII